MEKTYAQVLWSLVSNGSTPHAAVGAIKAKLQADGRSALLPRVARAFARLSEREAGRNTVVLTVAREKDERHAKSAAKEILAQLGADADGLKTQVDDSIIGGWRLEGRGMLVDNSYKSTLLNIYNQVTK
jgi:F0F1-type ATP synthase delta subunit